jgi:hypothetical protein
MSNLRYSVCVRVEENFCRIKWETDDRESFSWGSPFNKTNLSSFGASGTFCNSDDFITIDGGITEDMEPEDDRICGNKFLEYNYVICKFSLCTKCLQIIFHKTLLKSLSNSFSANKTFSIVSQIKWLSQTKCAKLTIWYSFFNYFWSQKFHKLFIYPSIRIFIALLTIALFLMTISSIIFS